MRDRWIKEWNLWEKKIPWHYSIFLAEMAIWLKQNKPRAVVHHTLEWNTNNKYWWSITNQVSQHFFQSQSAKHQQSNIKKNISYCCSCFPFYFLSEMQTTVFKAQNRALSLSLSHGLCDSKTHTY